MSEAEVVYSEVKFQSQRGNTDGPASSPQSSEVRVSGPQPSSKLPASQQQQQQQPASSGRSKSRPERATFVTFVVLGVLVAAAIVALGLTCYQMMHLQKLTDELDAVERNLTEDSCAECEDGWEQRGAECYYFSNNQLTWEQSRRACGCRGGALVRIGNRAEQEYLAGQLRGKGNQPDDLFWIGLTDSEQEGAWLWTDGSPLDWSESFWSRSEPDNFLGKEDCAATKVQAAGGNVRRWVGLPCGAANGHICDKPARTRRSECV
ncbi:immune-related, lectin-like receptor 4 isoform X2 [Pseudoliparis swirei]|uniref:immune-related, lectin-like receptor 4 isoform X2 n=1 Tax=Pseudoliparis swirei TaxID=2059687 RepID=UPI0024BEE1FF|nr:immune-related, lectin-like receptor 4 isoform X2 [Pseudoliparis swirei]